MKQLIQILIRDCHIISYVSILLLSTSCAPIIYSPKLTLSKSEQTINKSVKVEKFTDISPKSDQKSKLFKFSLTNKNSFSGELDNEITNAVVTDLALNGLFKTLCTNSTDADFIMRGVIKKFSGIYTNNAYSKSIVFLVPSSYLIGIIVGEPWLVVAGSVILLSPFFGIPSGTYIMEVEISVSLYDKNNLLVGTYNGKSSTKQIRSLYKNNKDPKGELNNIFSQAMNQIREQIIKDKEKLEMEHQVIDK